MESLNVRMSKFVEANLAKEPPVPCDFKVGDTVTFTNEYGVVFKGKKIVGFSHEIDDNWRPESFIYLDWESYWFPTSPSTLQLEH